jgi:hypothetical protein
MPFGDLWMLRDAATPWFDVTPQPSLSEQRMAGGLTYDYGRGQIVMFGGQKQGVNTRETFRLTAGPAHRPGVRFSVNWEEAGVPISAIESITWTVSAGAVGFHRASLGQENGAQLRIWNPQFGQWRNVVSNTAGPGSPANLSFTSPNAAWARRMVRAGSEHIDAQITSRYVDGGDAVAEVGVDHVELRVVYRR